MKIVADGLNFPEGPIALSDGGVLVVEIESGHLTRVGPSGQIERLAYLGGGPNGAAVGPDGAVYICNNGGLFDFAKLDGRNTIRPSDRLSVGGSIQRWDPTTGAVDVLYDGCEGRKLYGPNDIAFDSAGGFWFTDNGASVAEGRAWGALYYAAPDGSRIQRVKDRLLSANGVGLSPDESVVFVADTLLQRLWAFDVLAPGVLSGPLAHGQPGRIIANLPGYQMLDSLALQADGAVCVATLFNGGISTFALDGVVSHRPTPDDVPTNLCFGGADMRDVWITGSGLGVLYRTRWSTPGLRLPFNL